ncbi:MAG: PKD domain-containing protein, partial [Bacteroidetes bacterium]|nr:PKD domain-containing protein [Bacteroidota bacterium]
FTDSSEEYGYNPPFSAVWDFGDGSAPQTLGTPVRQVTTHSYTPSNPAGLNPFTVNLTVTDGFCVQSLSKTIVLGNVPVDFTVTPLICSGAQFPVQATSPNPELITGYYWHWEYNKDQPYVFDSSNKATLQSIIRSAPGIPHTLTLVVRLASGCLDSISHPVQVSYPDATFTPPAGACVNSAVPFTGTGTPDPATGSPVTYYSWDFGDGTAHAQGPNVTHQYADTGIYTVTLLIDDANGCARTYVSPTSIHITSPLARFGWSDTSFYCPKTPLTFTDSSIGYNLTDQWNYGDGSQDNTGIHAYAGNGSYIASLTVTDAFGCTNTQPKTILIQNPIASFDIADTTAICTPLQTMFTAHGQYYDSLYWDFGDGTTSTLPVTSHFYNTLDTFYAKLFVRGPGGCFDSATRRVLVLDPNKTTQLKFSPPSACDSVPAQFDTTPPGYTKFTLVFGDGSSDSSQNTSPFHMYRSPSTYTPTLVLTDVSGCIVNFGTSSNIKVLGSVPFIGL